MPSLGAASWDFASRAAFVRFYFPIGKKKFNVQGPKHAARDGHARYLPQPRVREASFYGTRTIIEVDAPPSAMPIRAVSCSQRIPPGDSQAITAPDCGMLSKAVEIQCPRSLERKVAGPAIAIVLMPPIRSSPILRSPFEEQA